MSTEQSIPIGSKRRTTLNLIIWGLLIFLFAYALVAWFDKKMSMAEFKSINSEARLRAIKHLASSFNEMAAGKRSPESFLYNSKLETLNNFGRHQRQICIERGYPIEELDRIARKIGGKNE